MTNHTLDGVAPLLQRREHRSGWLFDSARSLRRFIARKRLGAIGLAIVIFFMVLAAFAGPLGRYDPNAIFDRPNSNFKSNPTVAELAQDSNIGSPRIVDQFMTPGGTHWFGTDQVRARYLRARRARQPALADGRTGRVVADRRRGTAGGAHLRLLPGLV